MMNMSVGSTIGSLSGFGRGPGPVTKMFSFLIDKRQVSAEVQVDARDVDAHAVGRDDAYRLAVEVLTRGDQPAWDDPVAQDFLLAVDVVEVVLQGLDPLRDASLEPRPLGR